MPRPKSASKLMYAAATKFQEENKELRAELAALQAKYDRLIGALRVQAGEPEKLTQKRTHR